MTDKHSPARDMAGPPDVEPYEPPKIELLGTVGELTQGPDGPGGDINGLVISLP